MSALGPRATRQRAASGLGDADLLAHLASGQLGALGELYDRYHAPVRSFLARATRDGHDVDDLLQATFLAAAKSAIRYDGRPSARPWLMGIAATLLRRRHQSLARLVRALTSIKETLAPPPDPQPASQTRGDLERALAHLSEPKRVALLLAEVEGLSCEEVAQVLAVPVGTVWTRLHAARRELRQALGREEAP